MSNHTKTATRSALLGLAAFTAVAAGVTGLPATSSAAPGGVITGQVTFHETNPDREIEVFRSPDNGATWTEDTVASTLAASDGSYTVQVPAGEPVKLRASYGDHAHGYWYGDGFGAVTAAPVEAAAGQTVSDIDLNVPAPAYVTGTLTDKAGNAIAGNVDALVNNDGGLRPLADSQASSATTGYTAIVPAGYDVAILGSTTDGSRSAWLGGGSVSEPNSYLNLTAGQQLTGSTITLPVAAPSTSPAVTAPTTLAAKSAPVITGTAVKARTLRATAGTWNAKPTTVRYQWLRNGSAIRGATASTYRLTKADVSKKVRVRVTAARTGAHSGAALSKVTATVKNR